jgi:hypothetical protein
VHLFWGSFDLAVTRFSGRRAPLFTGKAPGLATRIMQEAYSHEVSSAGFWPGGRGVDASFYSYAYPSPPEFAKAKVRPADAFYNAELGEFLLPYEAVRAARDPDAALLDFLSSTYEAAAVPSGWDRRALECPMGRRGMQGRRAAQDLIALREKSGNIPLLRRGLVVRMSSCGGWAGVPLTAVRATETQ